ncbi:hypothetical protein QEH52_17840 [Coraliomargarita sp. SDUM461003]|uniref:Uncharacterized protein n=1 Tax=Thalassobacterium maritimum TaxID=3041265 RepID=A0ABU1AZ37_9BACT|nr:hypothetical protein [Coraliomargarita sp. SDUM461003]MDQ8209395.1 hypothetical protein [Coraliomargarita sp. SDUM461003]
MKIIGKQVALNFATLGYSGYREAKKRIEKNSLKERVAYSEQILGFMLALPIIMALITVMGLLESVAVLDEFLGTVDEMNEYNYPRAGVIETLTFIPFTFILFCFLHLYLGLAAIQHMPTLKGEDRNKIILFGFYAIDWSPSEYLKDSDPDDTDNPFNPPVKL